LPLEPSGRPFSRIFDSAIGLSEICEVGYLIGEPGRIIRARVEILDEGIHVETPGVPVELIDDGGGIRSQFGEHYGNSVHGHLLPKLDNGSGFAGSRSLGTFRIDMALDAMDHVRMDVPTRTGGRGSFQLNCVLLFLRWV